MEDRRAIVAVLAGGLGERLGGGKPAAVLAGRALIDHPLRAADAAGLHAIVVAKRGTPLPEVGVPVVYEPDEPRHPLRGVITALEYASERPGLTAVLTVGCDMPFLTGPLLAWLAELDGVVTASVDGRAQPLLSRCTLTALPALTQALADGRSLSSALASLGPRVVGESELGRFGDPARLCFNVNDPAELRTARRWLGARSRVA
jgi:molybdenum cofactor guanylyltransferase